MKQRSVTFFRGTHSTTEQKLLVAFLIMRNHHRRMSNARTVEVRLGKQSIWMEVWHIMDNVCLEDYNLTPLSHSSSLTSFDFFYQNTLTMATPAPPPISNLLPSPYCLFRSFSFFFVEKIHKCLYLNFLSTYNSNF